MSGVDANSKIPVLLVVSRSINVQSLNGSPRYTGYHFTLLPALSYLGTSSSRKAAKSLWEALSEAIRRMHPLYVIAHLGMAFERYPVEFLSALLDAKALYPEIKLGADRGMDYAMKLLGSGAQSTPATSALLRRLALNETAFESGKEILHLVGCPL